MEMLGRRDVRSRQSNNLSGRPDLNRGRIMDTVVGNPSVAVSFITPVALAGTNGPSGLSPLERDTLRTLLTRTFNDHDGPAPRGGATFPTGPFSAAALARYPGNGLFAALTGGAVDRVVHRFDDAVFRDTVNNLLDMAGTSPCTTLLRSAFDSVDLRSLSAADRSRFLAMLSLSVASGGPGPRQAQALLDLLAATQPPGWMDGGCQQNGGTISCQLTGSGTANIDLGNGYALHINQANSEIDLVDSNTGNTTTIWGDPHMGMNGNDTEFQFKGNVTLNLPDGTRITLQTTPWEGNSNAFLVQNVVVTRGSQAVVVKDMDQNSTDLGKLTIQQYEGAGQLERLLNADGTELYLNSAGNGWDVLQDGLYLRPMTEQDLENGDRAEASGSAALAWNLGVLSGLMAELSLDGQCEYSAMATRL
jgi:hypothetical protein